MYAIATAPRRDSNHWEQGDITWDELLAWAEHPADVKECGQYILGTLKPDTTVIHKGRKKPCTNLHRRKGFIFSRSGITLDVDHPRPGFADQVELTFPWAGLLHTTFSSSPDDLRYRLIIPTDREMTPDEYVAAATTVMDRLGADQFDPSTTEPERYMFKPSAQQPDWYTSIVLEGDPAPVADLLADYDPDLRSKPLPSANRTKRDPFTLEGVVGAFNRAYEDLDLLIETYELPYAQVDEERYQLVGASSVAGMGPISSGLYFSHHVTDPAYGETCTAFDLVRLHRFGDLDEGIDPMPVNRRPSHEAMLELASVDARVTAELVGLDFDPEDEDVDPDAWKLGLRLHSRTGKLLDVIGNWDLIAAHDPAFAGLYFNELSLSVETDRDLPWRPLGRGGQLFTGVDRSALCHYIERTYGIRPGRTLMDEVIDTTAHRRRVNPVRDYLEALVWDGKPRVEECLPGVTPTAFTRMVARKSMVAAVARALNPGCKWDHTLVLYGSEGLGKSFWIEKMSRGYMASLGPLREKDTLLTMQRSWIMVADEGHSLRKTDNDVQKEFLTRTEDVFRMPYDRDTVVHKRHCVIWSTTNDETFLRRQEGNRRYLIVHCETKVDFNALTPDYVDQVWAEAVYLFKQGERLFLDDLESMAAVEERERFVEEDALAGVLSVYLETLVPEDWEEMSPERRVEWLRARNEGLIAEPGTERITRVSTIQLWVEALGRTKGTARRTDLLDIGNTLRRLEGWEPLPGTHRTTWYGTQKLYGRQQTTEERFAELL